MTRLIDAEALLEAIRADRYTNAQDAIFFITNAPTVQREGWVSVEDLQRLYDDMFRHKDIAISANSLLKLIQQHQRSK